MTYCINSANRKTAIYEHTWHNRSIVDKDCKSIFITSVIAFRLDTRRYNSFMPLAEHYYTKSCGHCRTKYKTMNLLTTIIFVVLASTSSTLDRRDTGNKNGRCALKLESDQSFSAVQCKGDRVDGRCFCYSSSGSRIFGSSWMSSSKNMTCVCSRERDRQNTKLKRKDTSLHCAENGNYDELQCDNGLCWCVATKTGRPTERLYPQSMMKYLPCFSAEKTPNYLRQCESKALARLSVLDKLEAHGRFNTHIDLVLCDDDGSYRSYKLVKNTVWCVWKDGKTIANYQSKVGNIKTMNCNCARDTIIFAEENVALSIDCEDNGNYVSSQTSNGRPYCVDSDGCATTDLGDFGEVLNC